MTASVNLGLGMRIDMLDLGIRVRVGVSQSEAG